MDDLKKRLSSIETTINNLVNSLKKIEDVKKKKDLYSFSNTQLIKWLKDNEVDFEDSIKDTLVDTVWTNINDWEWEYYYEEDEEDEEDEEESEKKSDSESLSSHSQSSSKKNKF